MLTVRYLQLVACGVVFASQALSQVGNGTITGTVTDPAGAVVPGAAIEAKNTATGVAYSAVSTNTGNYTISDLPVGVYDVSVKVTGFKTYTHTRLAVPATQVLRDDVALQVGNATEAVTVTAEATLLKTETGELASNVSIDQLDELPLLGIGTNNSGSSGFRNPYNSILTLPGISTYSSSNTFVLNGLGNVVLTETMKIEGQDATSRIFGTYDYTQMAQPNADSIQEIAYQTSNYAAEFGQAGVAVINMTMKSGTNQYHGSGYDYFVNEDLNAGDPFTVSGGPGSLKGGNGSKYRPRNRRNDFGGTMGGPVVIPKIYNGHNKSFWFFSYEEYLETTQYAFNDTVPTAAFARGDFSAVSPNGNCGACATYGIPTGPLGGSQVDALGRQMFANVIYDPLTRGVNSASNLGYANPFPNNQVPVNRFDPVSVKIAALFPAAQTANLTNNYAPSVPGNRYSAIPAVKIDHNLSPKDKLSFYYSENNTESQVSLPFGGADGLPFEIGQYRGTFIPTYTERLNYDRTLTPTLLLHIGAGYFHTSFDDHAPFTSFDPASVGLVGFIQHRQFPLITGMNSSGATSYGGMQNIGTAGQIQTLNYDEKPSVSANATWIKGSHTFKAGAELYLEGIIGGTFSGVTLATGTGPTSQPFTPTNSFNGFSQGFGYASFLLGDYSSTLQTAHTDPREGTQQWGFFVQDSWKVTRKLTLDYGLRWDYATPNHEQYGRLGQLNTTLTNANAGGHPGATQYAATCGCQFYQNAYPYALGPRLGIAYQIDPKTVFRAGWGINYQFVAANAGAIVSTNGNYPLTGINPYVNISSPGSIVAPVWPVTDPNRYPAVGLAPGAGGNAPSMPDANQNRPPRIDQWSIGLQREITRNFVMQASYVGNHSAWVSGPLGFMSQISAARYAQFGLYPYPGTGPTGYNNDADRALLTQSLSSAAVVQKLKSVGIASVLPYAGFPTSNSLQSALYPFPQFGAIGPSGSATGNTKYDSLQITATKRFSHNFQGGGAYTWAQGRAGRISSTPTVISGSCSRSRRRSSPSTPPTPYRRLSSFPNMRT